MFCIAVDSMVIFITKSIKTSFNKSERLNRPVKLIVMKKYDNNVLVSRGKYFPNMTQSTLANSTGLLIQ